MSATVKNPLADLLAEKGVLLADGATGTNLFDMGLTSGDPPEEWNVTEPDKIRALHGRRIKIGGFMLFFHSTSTGWFWEDDHSKALDWNAACRRRACLFGRACRFDRRQGRWDGCVLDGLGVRAAGDGNPRCGA